MSLNSVVNNLVRAAAGIPASISDSDLDAHVAKLLADEAKAKEMKWSELGLTGLLGTGLDRGDSPDPSLPKPNKRFLASVIRTVDGHNTALLRQQAQSAREAREEKLGESSRAGVGSGSGSGAGRGKGPASRLFGGALRDMGRVKGDGKGKEREREREKERERAGDQRQRRYDDEDRRSRHHEDERRSRRYEDDDSHRRSSTHVDERSRRYGEEEEVNEPRREDAHGEKHARGHDNSSDERYQRRHREREHRSGHGTPREGDRSSDLRRGEKSSQGDSDDRDGRRRREHESTHAKHQVSPDTKSKHDPKAQERQKPTTTRERSLSPAPEVGETYVSPPSKMDKYFAQSYDPRLDLPDVPSQGIVQEVGWDNMLAILKERGKKRRHQSPTLSDTAPAPPPGVLPSRRPRSPSPDKRERKARKERKSRRRHDSSDSDSEDERREKRRDKRRKEKEREKKEKYKEKGYTALGVEGGGKGSGILEGYDYVKKGGTREWDVGK